MFPLVLQVNARVWLDELSRRHGRKVTLGDLPASELDAWKSARFNAVWLMGVWERSPAARQIALEHPDLQDDYARALPGFRPDDVGASPYATIAYQVERELGGREGLATFRRQLQAAGMKLILDFVPNHVAVDHPWTGRWQRFIRATPSSRQRHPDWFQKVGGEWLAHGRDPYFPPWTDTLQLNYGEADVHAAMKEELLRVASMCDGVRCDMAMLVLRDIFNRTWDGMTPPMQEEFWPGAASLVRSRFPDFLLIAEAYWDTGWQLQQMGFDFTYDKTMYDRLSQRDAAGVRAHLKAEWNYHKRLLRFIENHDEPRAPERFEGFHKCAALLTLAAPGMRLVQHGQLDGQRVRLPVQLKRAPAEDVDEDTRRFYARLLPQLANPAIERGGFGLLEAGARAVAFERRASDGHTVTVVNLTAESVETSIRTRAFEGVRDVHELRTISTSAYQSPQFDVWPGGVTVRLRALEGLLFVVR